MLAIDARSGVSERRPSAPEQRCPSAPVDTDVLTAKAKTAAISRFPAAAVCCAGKAGKNARKPRADRFTDSYDTLLHERFPPTGRQRLHSAPGQRRRSWARIWPGKRCGDRGGNFISANPVCRPTAPVAQRRYGGFSPARRRFDTCCRAS